ncbi:hypothetical protein QQ045_013920 [Rhodiola kirilowii]
MSCNGCRALRKGCGDSCVLRPSLQWIVGHQAQANAILFAAKFFGRSDLIGFLSAVPDDRKPALFQSLLFEACGRAVNPVSGAVGLLSTGNWHLCKAAVDSVLFGRSPQPLPEFLFTVTATSTPKTDENNNNNKPSRGLERRRHGKKSIWSSFASELSSSDGRRNEDSGEGSGVKVLNLFV